MARLEGRQLLLCTGYHVGTLPVLSKHCSWNRGILVALVHCLYRSACACSGVRHMRSRSSSSPQTRTAVCAPVRRREASALTLEYGVQSHACLVLRFWLRCCCCCCCATGSHLRRLELEELRPRLICMARGTVRIGKMGAPNHMMRYTWCCCRRSGATMARTRCGLRKLHCSCSGCRVTRIKQCCMSSTLTCSCDAGACYQVCDQSQCRKPAHIRWSWPSKDWRRASTAAVTLVLGSAPSLLASHSTVLSWP